MASGSPPRAGKRRGLPAPKLTIASAEQRCWNHKLRNVLDTVPKKHQPEVKAALQAIASANFERAATAGRDAFARMDGRAHPKTVERLERDWARMTASYAFPAKRAPPVHRRVRRRALPRRRPRVDPDPKAARRLMPITHLLTRAPKDRPNTPRGGAKTSWKDREEFLSSEPAAPGVGFARQ